MAEKKLQDKAGNAKLWPRHERQKIDPVGRIAKMYRIEIR